MRLSNKSEKSIVAQQTSKCIHRSPAFPAQIHLKFSRFSRNKKHKAFCLSTTSIKAYIALPSVQP